ncbi:hypothetical protein L6452_13867 [Arctium lappa]|uniref:Uncharacterized protein n=1 Tax=Arctium lappa TaxID=4217 RepID=A0ACB9CJB2_ARCLA|nr:hypothetical protein L6452_13867 [Arctium lappa]
MVVTAVVYIVDNVQGLKFVGLGSPEILIPKSYIFEPTFLLPLPAPPIDYNLRLPLPSLACLLTPPQLPRSTAAGHRPFPPAPGTAAAARSLRPVFLLRRLKG